MSTLPILSSTSTHYPDCCLSLSTTFFNFLSGLFLTTVSSSSQSTINIFSIGSGTGLLEALLSRHLSSKTTSMVNNTVAIQVVGVEVYASPPVNKYLDDDQVCLVRGTWDVYDVITKVGLESSSSSSSSSSAAEAAAAAAAAWMFVYPRHVKLVEKYIDTLIQLGSKKSVHMVIWAGPRADLADYEDAVFGKLLQAGGGGNGGDSGGRWVREQEQDTVVTGVAEWEAVVVLRWK